MNMSSVASASYCGGVYYWRDEKVMSTKAMYNAEYIIKISVIGLKGVGRFADNFYVPVVDASDPKSYPYYSVNFVKCREYPYYSKYVLVDDMFIPLMEDIFCGWFVYGEPTLNEKMLRAAWCAIDGYHMGANIISIDSNWNSGEHSKAG